MKKLKEILEDWCEPILLCIVALANIEAVAYLVYDMIALKSCAPIPAVIVCGAVAIYIGIIAVNEVINTIRIYKR